MAEQAANYYRTHHPQPTIFEIVAQKSLNETLQPAFYKVASLISAVDFKYFKWLGDYYDETYLVLNGLLQYHYLKNHSASFSEYFYGLKRLTLKDVDISLKQKQLSWLFIVTLPYFNSKINKHLEEFRIQKEDNLLENNWRGKLKGSLVNFQAFMQTTWGVWTLITYLRYMSESTESQFPAIKLLNLKLSYSHVPDNFHIFWTNLFKGKLSLTETWTGLLQHAVRTTLELSAFFVQFLHAWNLEQSNFDMTALPTVEAPQLETNAGHYKHKCPLCLKKWKIPSVLPVSGYVFCFSCIYKYLKEHNSCPVTNYPARPLDIIRIYK